MPKPESTNGYNRHHLSEDEIRQILENADSIDIHQEPRRCVSCNSLLAPVLEDTSGFSYRCLMCNPKPVW